MNRKRVFKLEETDEDSVALDRVSSVVNPIVNRLEKKVRSLKANMDALKEKYEDVRFKKERIKIKSETTFDLLKKANEIEFRGIRMEHINFRNQTENLLDQLRKDLEGTKKFVKKTTTKIKKRVARRMSMLEERELKLKVKEQQFEQVKGAFEEDAVSANKAKAQKETLEEKYRALLDSQREVAQKFQVYKRYFDNTSRIVRENEEGDNLQKLLKSEIFGTNKKLVMMKRNKSSGSLVKSPKEKLKLLQKQRFNMGKRSKSFINLKRLPKEV